MYEKLFLNGSGKLVYESSASNPEGQKGIVIKNLYCGICSTDLKMIREGQRDLVYPVTPGHEIVGMVESGDTGKSGVKKGDIVQVYPGITCGGCRYCTRGEENLCESIRIIGFNYDGGFSSHTFLPSGSGSRVWLNPVSPDGIKSADEAYIYTLAEPLASCLNVFEKIKIHDSDRIAVIGAGLLGQLCSLVSVLNGPKEVYLFDYETGRKAVVPGEIRKVVIRNESEELEILGEIEPDIVIIATGSLSVVEKLIGVVARGGRIAFFSGLIKNYGLNNVDFNTVHYRELTLRGFYGSTPGQNRRAVDLINRGIVEPGCFTGNIYPLAEYRKALGDAYGKKTCKTIFKLY